MNSTISITKYGELFKVQFGRISVCTANALVALEYYSTFKLERKNGTTIY